MLEELAPPMRGKQVLITASAGRMGLLLIQLAHQADHAHRALENRTLRGKALIRVSR